MDRENEKKSIKNKLQRAQIRFALYSLIASGVVGVFFREFMRAFSEGLTGEELFFSSYNLSLDHGHLLSIGFVVPLGLALITFFLKEKLDEKTYKKLNTRFTIYMITGILVFCLIFYKGIHYAVLGSTQFDFNLIEIDEMLFGGSVMVRSMLYAMIHSVYGVSALLYSIPLLKGLKQ